MNLGHLDGKWRELIWGEDDEVRVDRRQTVKLMYQHGHPDLLLQADRVQLGQMQKLIARKFLLLLPRS